MKIKVLQINLNRCRTAHDAMEERVRREKFDLCIISEANPMLSKRNTERDEGWMSDTDADSAVWWTGSNRALTIRSKKTSKGITEIILTDDTQIVSCYFSPNRALEDFRTYLEELKTRIDDHRDSLTTVAGDFNAASLTWGSWRTDRRGREIEDWAAELSLCVVNDGDTPTLQRSYVQLWNRSGASDDDDSAGEDLPSTDTPRATPEDQRLRVDESWVDLTMTNRLDAITEWTVNELEESHSDHLFLEFEIESDADPQPPGIPIRWQGRRLNKEVLRESVDEGGWRITGAEDHVDDAQIDHLLRPACAKAAPPAGRGYGGRKAAFWWSDTIATLRRACLKARRAYVRARRKIDWEPGGCVASLNRYRAAKEEYEREIRPSKRPGASSATTATTYGECRTR